MTPEHRARLVFNPYPTLSARVYNSLPLASDLGSLASWAKEQSEEESLVASPSSCIFTQTTGPGRWQGAQYGVGQEGSALHSCCPEAEQEDPRSPL